MHFLPDCRPPGRPASSLLTEANPLMRPLRNLIRFLRELLAFARDRKKWWIIPVVVLLLLVALFVVGVSTISPFIYSLF